MNKYKRRTAIKGGPFLRLTVHEVRQKHKNDLDAASLRVRWCYGERMASALFILNGPNLNRLGTREPDVYGHTTLGDIERMCRETADDIGFDIEFRQTNFEGMLVDWIQEAGDVAQGLIINPAAYTHTSVAIRDAITTADIPTVEVHLSNIHARDAFRHHSYVSPVAYGVICGFGATGYRLAIEALSEIIRA